MSSPFAAEGIWRPLPYDEAWALVDAHLDFRPDFYERETPAIDLPAGSLVIDLSPVFSVPGPRFAAGLAAVNAAALRNFVWLTADEELIALDWQHTPYRYNPGAHALAGLPEWPVPVFPDGDYFIHHAPRLEWGTLGHPWQQTLTLWGDPLVRSLGRELLTWLPRHPQSLA
ncbi:DUF2716 domain-containing protein [Actinotalea ferrariae]|uniref:DUF2716 domain-containing protein n=1 Tax=Actinotalea ferrariae TaxID=1386098 RepID=UPI001C8BDBD8|nr:DUF2716 domain-containing protein [Actinotalea ferrariae]MBX9245974.1 DUF2716 domain-containing protein [Actinotalea ferrariae]